MGSTDSFAPARGCMEFGTLAALHPGRIDLGLGRAPGGDRATFHALRRDPSASDDFPQDVAELQAYLKGEAVNGVRAMPGAGSRVPLYILGSSLFGAQLAARMGLTYGFASHFASDQLKAAVALYRGAFRPSAQLDRPHVIAGVNVIVGDTEAEARAQLTRAQRMRASVLIGGGRTLSDAEADQILAAPQGRFLADMMRYTAVGTPEVVRTYLQDFARHADADELMLALSGPTLGLRLRALDVVAEG